MAEAEERTQGPSQRRRMLAREQGMVARSPELTAAAVLLMGALLLGAWGDELGTSLVEGTRASWSDFDPATLTDAQSAASMVLLASRRTLVPLASLLGGIAMAGLVAHQAQVGGLWLPGMLAPNPARLWRVGEGPDLVDRSFRGAWSLAKALVVLAVGALSLWTHRWEIAELGPLGPSTLAASALALVRSAFLELGVALLALGTLDLMAQRQRIEVLLRTTPEQHREELKAVDGDPALRARRRRMAQSRKFDPIEAVTGASLLVVGPQGLTLVLGGGPPPGRRILVRAIAQGADGQRLRRAAEQMGLMQLRSARVAQHLARRDRAPLPPELATELAAVWPPRLRPADG
jgi:flagellar biosynthetic protein FlhB